MERAVQLKGRIHALEELTRIVAAMRSLAATYAQQASGALEGLRSYAAVVEEALLRARGTASSAPAPGEARVSALDFIEADSPRPRYLVVLASEHGFAGAFNTLLLEQAKASLAKKTGALAVLGTRGMAAAAEHGLHPAWTLPMAASLKDVALAAQSLLAQLDSRFEKGEFIEVDVLFARYTAEGRLDLVEQRLVPVEPRPLEQAGEATTALTYLPDAQLKSLLAREYLFAELTRVVVESVAAENTARLHAMDLARQKVGERLSALRLVENQVRQEEITTELLDLVTGATALTLLPLPVR